MILQNSQSCLSLKLLVVQGHQVSLSLLDFEVHLLCQLLYILNLFKLGLVDPNHALLFVGLQLLRQTGYLELQVLLLLCECVLFD